MTRRDLGRLAAAGMGALAGNAAAQSGPAPNRSNIHDVQFGLQPFCYHDLAMTPANRTVLINRLAANGMGMVELHAVWCEPRFDGPGVTAEEARDRLRKWRLAPPADHYRNIRREFDDAGIRIFSYYVNFGPAYTDDEIHATFEGAKILGAGSCIGSYGLETARRLASFPGRHGMYLGLHNHDNVSDPDAFSTEATFEKGLGYSKDFMATLDVRHFTAANGDCLGFLERHHDRVSSVHLGDRRRNNGRSTPFGEGDAPIVEILRLIRDNRWPIVALLEFEHGTLRTEVEEVRRTFDYCKRALS